MRFTWRKATLLAAMIAAGGAANAQPFFVCVPDAADGPGACTGVASQFAVDLGATSYYTDVDNSNSISIGDTIVDKSDNGTVTALLDADGNSIGGSNNQGIGFFWTFDFAYDDLTSVVAFVDDSLSPAPDGEGQIGEIVQVGGPFLSGTIEVSYNNDQFTPPDANNGARLFDLIVTGGSITAANAILDGRVDFTNADPIAQNMFFYANGDNVYDLWADGELVQMRFDTNIDPIAIAASTDPAFDFERFSTLNGSVSFVPVPGTLAILGLGLLGLGIARRRFAA
jgi:hypothetical protein